MYLSICRGALYLSYSTDFARMKRSFPFHCTYRPGIQGAKLLNDVDQLDGELGVFSASPLIEDGREQGGELKEGKKKRTEIAESREGGKQRQRRENKPDPWQCPSIKGAVVHLPTRMQARLSARSCEGRVATSRELYRSWPCEDRRFGCFPRLCVRCIYTASSRREQGRGWVEVEGWRVGGGGGGVWPLSCMHWRGVVWRLS